MRIYVGADHNGFTLKKQLLEYLRHNGYEVEDVGDISLDPQDDYPQFAAQVVAAMKTSNDADARGLLICGSGQGICIAANRFKGIRAAVCDDPEEARAGRNDDDTNVLCLPARTVDLSRAETVLKVWLDTGFAGASRFRRRIAELDNLG